MLAIVLATVMIAPAASSSAVSSGLRGKVTLAPSKPVCTEDESCSKPAPGVLLTFRREGRTAATVTTTPAATFRVLLPPGPYTVVAPRYRVGSGVTPRVVRVPRGRIARVDLEIDTGIQ